MSNRKLRCPMEVTIEVIGGKWKPMILFHLLGGTKRFGELKHAMPDATRQMLTQHLRELESHGIIHREVYPQVPPKVEYSLTPVGWTLKPVLLAMTDWANRYQQGELAAVTAEATPAHTPSDHAPNAASAGDLSPPRGTDRAGSWSR
jgi:DNA-binding HxlR family transcriptional regulator